MEYYIYKRLKRINSVLTQRQMAARLGVHENSIRNWMKNPGSVKISDVQAIRKLHIKLRHKIAWKERQGARNE